MKFEDARRQGERTVSELRAKFRQNLGNARFIGSLSLTGLLTKLRSGAGPTSVEPTTGVLRDENLNRTSGTPPRYAILSATELVDLLQTCSIEQAREILDYETLNLGRLVVLEAARRRVGT